MNTQSRASSAFSDHNSANGKGAKRCSERYAGKQNKCGADGQREREIHIGVEASVVPGTPVEEQVDRRVAGCAERGAENARHDRSRTAAVSAESRAKEKPERDPYLSGFKPSDVLAVHERSRYRAYDVDRRQRRRRQHFEV